MNDAFRTIAVLDLDLLHQRQPEALGGPALDLALERLGVHRLADLLRGRELDDPDQTEFEIDVDDRSVGGERELDVSVALAVLVERVGLPRTPLDRLLDRLVAEQSRELTMTSPCVETTASLSRRAAVLRPSSARAMARTRSRTASHAALTAPPVTYVWREADLDPAEPTACRP